jgi:hypothetical protein
MPSRNYCSASRLWISLIRTLPIIYHWISWCLGAGYLILVGCDKILGVGNKYFLSEELVTHLNQRHVLTLAQATSARDPMTIKEDWRSSNDLGLPGELANEWTKYTVELRGAGITLSENSEDILKWIGGEATGELSVKNCYIARLEGESMEMERPTENYSNFSGWHLRTEY